MGLFSSIFGGGSKTTVTQTSSTNVNNQIDIEIALDPLTEVFNKFNGDIKAILESFTSGQGEQTAAQKEANALLKIQVLSGILGKEQELQVETQRNGLFKAALLMGGSVLVYYGWKKLK